MQVELSKSLGKWIANNLASFPPSTDVVAFNIGLFEVEGGFCAYLAGSTDFDEFDDSWAVEPSYKPEDAYFALSEADYHFNDWQSCLKDVVSALSHALADSTLIDSPIAKAHAVTVGFDDGDLHRVR